MTKNNKEIEGVIWDLDNTLYRFTDGFRHHCNVAAAKAAKEKGIDLPYDDCVKIAERSEEEFGYSMHIYITHHGFSYADLHFSFHQNIDENIIEPIEGLIDKIKVINLPQIILTNGSRCWAERALTRIGANDLFDSNKIIAMEDVNFEPKARSLSGFRKALIQLGTNPSNTLFVDDLDRNLVKAKELDLQTAYVHYGDKMDILSDDIDYQFEDANAVINTLL
ncbi:MAG: HAD hydrolase-like protein [Alphaproteobacteria bacterium]|nr:HAD hydrolase-like protein [Alphaproteobacteria bacterium]